MSSFPTAGDAIWAVFSNDLIAEVRADERANLRGWRSAMPVLQQ